MRKAKKQTFKEMREESARRFQARQRKLPREKRERTYFAMKQSESLNEWIERIRQTRAAGKRPKETWEVGPDWDGEDDE